MDTEKLKAANIPETWWSDCYISTDGMIFTPDFDKSGTMIKTGEQAHNEWIANKISTLNEVKQAKLQEIKSLCESKIIYGIDCDVLGKGSLHYSLPESPKQNDMKILMESIKNGGTQVLWHDDSRVMHEVYTSDQFTELYKAVFNYISSCKIRSDGLEQYVVNISNDTTLNDSDKISKINTITWDITLPNDIQTIIDTQTNLMKLV